MDAVTVALFLMLAVVVSGVLSRMLPVAVPRPLVQIALGAVVGLAARFRVELDPDLFFLLFLPPLLFLDGWRLPKDALVRDRRAILGLALGLVVVTVLGAGLFIHWMIPTVPLSVAFALAAVVSPTDPIAVSSIAARVPVPARMMHILEGESLLNDASGLVCLRFAIAATLTGAFSPASAGLTFLWVALGGIGIGAGVAWAITLAQSWTSARFGEESGSHILTTLLAPFAAYLTAEHFAASGILAAVAAGIAMSVAETSGRTPATTRVRRGAVWDVVQFAVNGIIFVLLGEQLPGLLARAGATVRESGHGDRWWLALYVVAITAGLALLRVLWVWLWLRFTLLRDRRAAAGAPGGRLIAAFSVAGVRGAVTMAGVLTLPLALADGSPFPARDLAIFLAAGVILLSLVVASAGLPLLLRGLELPAEPRARSEEDVARVAAAEAAIAAVQRALRERSSNGDGDADLYIAAASRVVDLYRARIALRTNDTKGAERARRALDLERELQHRGVEAEREEVFRLIRAREVGSETGQKLIRELDLLDARYHE